MPFVNIYLPENFTREVKKEISLSIHESLQAIFKVPEKDYFQVIHPIKPGDMIFPDSYLDISHTNHLLYIYITCGIGRTADMKKALYATIAQKIAERTPVSANDVIIVLNETAWENWSFGQGLAQMIK